MPASRVAAAFRRGTLLLAVGSTAAFAACATKRDVKTLGDEISLLSARQDSLVALLRAQNRELMDSLRAGSEMMLQIRGELGHQLLQMEQQLVQLQELSGQSQRRLADLRRDLESRERTFDTTTPAPAAPPAAADSSAADQLYQIGMEKLRQGAPATARAAFQQILDQFATHPRASDAQFQIAETYVAEEEFDSAFREFDRVVELFPNSPRAPSALFRAGVIAEERGNIQRAREYFSRVQAGYPVSDEARLAGERLARLQGR
ncbi:MAG TPA: tetratricopeptide repeat protein [Longimicrobiales bacterium]